MEGGRLEYRGKVNIVLKNLLERRQVIPSGIDVHRELVNVTSVVLAPRNIPILYVV